MRWNERDNLDVSSVFRDGWRRYIILWRRVLFGCIVQYNARIVEKRIKERRILLLCRHSLRLCKSRPRHAALKILAWKRILQLIFFPRWWPPLHTRLPWFILLERCNRVNDGYTLYSPAFEFWIGSLRGIPRPLKRINLRELPRNRRNISKYFILIIIFNIDG